MAKKLISVWLSLTILLFSSISIYADENVQGDFFIKNIVINGETIDNNHLQFPFFLYKDTTYFPLTPEMSEILGLKAEMDLESRTLKLLKKEPSLSNISDCRKKNEREDVLTQVFSDVKVYAYEIDRHSLEEIVEDGESADTTEDIQNPEGTIDDVVIAFPELIVKEIDLTELPVLTKENIIYLPLRAMTGEGGFGWSVYYDPFTGIYVSTNADVPAESYWNEAESKYNRGLVNYIRSYNASHTENKAQELVFLFKNAAKTYGIDEKILMAVAHRESTFNPRSGANGGAVGIMQVMPSTGARYGLSVEQLLDAETSINFGAMYLSERITAYGGDLTKGFSAYNQGSVKVNRGTYSTRYANRVISTIDNINSYLTSNGYGLGY